MKRIKAVLFDMDGVLIDSEPYNLKQLYDFYETYGVTASDEFMISLVGSSIEYTAKESLRLLSKDWTSDELYERFDAYALNHPVEYKDILNPGVKETLHWLKEHGYLIAIGSSSQMKNIQRMMRECELEGLFDVVLSGEMFQESKPNPEIYVTIAQQLHVDAADCMVIEDSSYGIEAGKRAGMATIALQDTRFGIDQSMADGRISKIEDIQQMLSE